MKEWGLRGADKCPRCGARRALEGAPCAWGRQVPEARVVKSEGLFKLRKWMEEADTNEDVKRVLVARLTSWAFINARARPQRLQAQGTLEAIEAQGGVGWAPLVEGPIAKEWMKVQDDHHKLIGSRRSGLRRAAELANQEASRHRMGLVGAS